jgi:hypothetical protein
MDILAPYRVGPPWILATPELPLRCPMCNRPIADITMSHGRMQLIRGMTKRVGIPQGQPPSGRHATGVGWVVEPMTASGPRRPRYKGWVFVSPERDRWRVWCIHKGRGVLDRTVTVSTLERLYAAALAAGHREVVLT